MLTSGRGGSSGFPNLAQAGAPTFKITHVSDCHRCCGVVVGGTWHLTMSAFDLVPEGGDDRKKGSMQRYGEISSRLERVVGVDELRGGEEAADAFDAYIFQRGHQCS